MEGHCAKHVFEPTEALCRTCGGEFCGDCLVYAYGPKKPPYCVNCALSAAGVRSTAARPHVRSKREMKRELKEQKRQSKVSAKSAAGGSADDLFDAIPIPSGARPMVELEFTINDDGTVDRPDEPVVDEPVSVPARTPSIFDQTFDDRS
jgi:hypothetical protein